MPDEQLILELLDRIMESGHSPELVCGDDAELLGVVRDRWQRLRDVEAEVERLFPTPHPFGVDSGQRACGPRRSDEGWRGMGADRDLPSLPGYEVEAVLGSGGMGVVYKANHLRLNRPVAIKMLLWGAYATSQDLACLLREAQAVAALRHENIVRVHDVGDLNGLPYFTMEFLEGGTLSQKLGGRPQAPKEAAALVATLASAVHSAHQSGIVHRDLKPSNILLTADGTPKIADFSLARRFEPGADATLSAAGAGTPGYMAPEQVAGKADAFCPSVDIYALGALLYETLTGRPPFRAGSAAETHRQVMTEDPESPSRLNAAVPRDLETICLKALERGASRRYESGAAMAADLQRFIRGEPIAARSVGRAERLVKWVRRYPARATAAAALFAFAAVVLALAVAGSVDRARTLAQVSGDLAEIDRSRASGDWALARTALVRAKVRLGTAADAGLTQRIDAAERELAMVGRFETIRQARAAVVDGRFDRSANRATADAAYEAAFREAGLTRSADEDPAAVAGRISASSVRAALVDALDDWAASASGREGPARRAWLFSIARLVERDEEGSWRNRVRDPVVWDEASGDSLAALAAAMPPEEPSLSLLAAIGERLSGLGRDDAAVPFLKRVQRQHPGDFWSNLSLGIGLGRSDPAAAVRYLQAAVAIAPDAPVAHANLGVALGISGQLDESIEQFRQTIRLAPEFALSHDGLGNALQLSGRTEEALSEYKRAIELAPRSHSAHNNLGRALAELGRLDEALAEYVAAVAIEPASATSESSLGLVLVKLGRVDEAVEHCLRAVELDRTLAAGQLNLGIALRAQGRSSDALPHYERAVALDPASAESHSGLGNALYDVGRKGEAVACYREALRLDPRHAGAHHGLGIAAGDSGDFDEAISRFSKAVEYDPSRAVSSGALGRALMLQGKYAEALPALRRYLDSLPAQDPRAPGVAALVKRCERMVQQRSDR